MPGDNDRQIKRQSSTANNALESQDMQAANFDWGKRQAASESEKSTASQQRAGHPDGFITVDRSTLPSAVGASDRISKREESDIIWEFLPKGQSRIGGSGQATRDLEGHDGVSGPRG